MIGFPEDKLIKDGAGEVLEILKERRKAICEFILKILNSFRLVDVRIFIYLSLSLELLYRG